MICKNCGAEISEGIAFCGNCGMKTEAEQPAPEVGEYKAEVNTVYQEQGSYVPPVQPVYAEPVNNAPYTGEKPNTVLWIVLNAVELVSCCTVTGIIGLIYAILGHVAADKGDFADAAKKTKTAKIWFWVGIGLGIVFVILYIAFIVAMAGLGAAGTMIVDEFYYY